MKRSRFFKLLMGSSAAVSLPAALEAEEAEEEFVPEGIMDVSFFQQEYEDEELLGFFRHTKRTGIEVKLSWSKDGHLWLIHSNGSKRKLI